MLYVYNFQDIMFITSHYGDIIVDSVYCMSYKHKAYDYKPFFSIIRKHSLLFSDEVNGLRCSNLTFKALHIKSDAKEYKNSISGLPDEVKNSLTDCILVESYIVDDPLLLVLSPLYGTMFPLTNDRDFDLYAGLYSKFHKYQYLMKIRNSFKLQEYVHSGHTSVVNDRHFRYDHVKNSISYNLTQFTYDDSFYVRNRRLFDGDKKYKYGSFELFFQRDSRNYPQ